MTSAHAPTPPPAPKKRRLRGALLGLCGLALVAGGFLYGRSLSTDSQATVERATSVGAAQVEGQDVPIAGSVSTQEVDEVAEEATSVAPSTSNDAGDEPIVAVAKAVSPSVVLITTDDGQGSGIVYDASGLIITNAHVVAGASAVNVMLPDGRRVPAEVVGADDETDIAMVQIRSEVMVDIELGPGFTPAVFAPTDTVDVGQLSVAIGSPFGLEQTVTAGIISAVNRPVSLGQSRPTHFFIQTDAPINPGNSGGALADREGRVVGMNTLIRTGGTSQGNIGVGFAIPADTMQFVAERIIAGEEIQHSFLGISGGDPVVGEPGAVIGEVFAGLPAAAAGLQIGDRIVSFNGEEIAGMGQLAATVRLSPQNQPIEVMVVRDDQLVTVNLELVPAPPAE